jgi:hypothetical protein
MCDVSEIILFIGYSSTRHTAPEVPF